MLSELSLGGEQEISLRPSALLCLFAPMTAEIIIHLGA